MRKVVGKSLAGLLVFAMAAACVAGGSEPAGVTSRPSHLAYGDGRYLVAVRALDGDPEAAMRLADEFAKRERWDRAEYWFQIAAENGSATAMQHLSVILAKVDCRRAVFWKRRYIETLKREKNPVRPLDEQNADLTAMASRCSSTADRSNG